MVKYSFVRPVFLFERQRTMLHVFGIVVSSLILSVSQPLTHNNGWNFASASAASSHCPCCKDKVCHCGMAKTKSPLSSQASGSSAPCCGKTRHLPAIPSAPLLAANNQIGNELVKHLTSAREVAWLFEAPKVLMDVPCTNISPPVFSVRSFPLRV
jgi:hypothetical protein